MVLGLFKDAHEQAERNIYTPAFEVTVEAAAKSLFTERAEELLDDKVYKLVESRDFTQCLVHHLMKSSTFTVLVSRFAKQ